MNTTKIIINVTNDVPEDQLLALYESCQWYAYTQGPRQSELHQAVRDSTYVVTAWDGNQLVGLARGLSDDSAVFFLQGILIRPEFQCQGIGQQLLENCLERFKHVRDCILLTGNEENQNQFYENLGYKNTKDIEKFTLNTFVILGRKP
ncbi:MAG: GNAT family N-acetyltransferase [Candidatus Hermodarchaeia archaeon]|jgi:ribosomal protein S18 acetylase RimI-like enzyme